MPLSTNEIIQKYLKSQHVSDEELLEILKPTSDLENSPFDILDVRDWLNKLYQHRNDVITIVGDYDADGILSSATMRQGLQILGVGSKINTYVPTRMDGYGMTPTSVNQLAQQFPDTQTIVTVDNGVAAFAGVQAAKDLGYTVLVTDHHLAKEEGLPIADAIVDINRPGDEYPFKGISGTAMAYKMLVGYATILKPNLLPMIESLRTLVGISTITDMMPLRHENRYWVKYALNESQKAMDEIMSPHAEPHLYQLITTLNKNGKIYGNDATEDLYGFTIGPILNAPSRVYGTPQLAYDLFMTDDVDQMQAIANELITVNEERKATVGQIANQQAQTFQQQIDQGISLPAIASTVALTSGFVGLIAGNLSQKFNVPTIVFSTKNWDNSPATDILHGSARSIPGVSIVEILTELQKTDPNIIITFGGHAAAAGVSIRADRFDDFNKLFQQITASLKPMTTDSTNQPSNDFIIDPDDVSLTLINAINRLAPFGQDFPRPEFIFTNQVTAYPTFMGTQKQHIKFKLPNQIEAIRWNGHDEFEHLGTPAQMSFAGKLDISEFMGRKRIQMIINDWQN